MESSLVKKRLVVIVTLNVTIIVLAFCVSYLLRFDFQIPSSYTNRMLSLLPIVLLIKLPILWKFNLLKGWWRYVSMPDLAQLLKGNIVASLALILCAVFVYRLENIPRTVLLLDGVLCFLLMGGVRFATRAFRERTDSLSGTASKSDCRVLIVGAGQGGQAIVREVRANPRLGMKVVGFVDDDRSKKGIELQGVKVLGRIKDLGSLVDINSVEEVIIAIPSASGQQVRIIVEYCRTAQVKFKILPGVGDLLNGRVSLGDLRDVDLEDLLGRQPIQLDEAQVRDYLCGKRVLVTGAGGSIGSEICRQVAKYRPEKLILFDNAETPLFHIEAELKKTFSEIHLVPIVGDVRNQVRVEGIFDEQLPQVVFHAAAYKHVPMMECNPAEAVLNNIKGSCVVADAANAFKVDTFVMVSTDKAVRPTNVMGTSKRVAELYVQALAKESRTRYVTTRFGNVLGSNGSVIPTFKEQIRQGGPVTVTDPEVTRFFMTIPEATQLVLQAGSMGQGGDVFLFDMGEPVKIVKLAEELIKLSGLRPYEDIDIVFTGLRPGEKLYEELLLDGEGTLPTSHDKICRAKADVADLLTLKRPIAELFTAAEQLDFSKISTCLKGLVPEYTPGKAAPRAKVLPHPAVVDKDVVRIGE